MTRPRILPAPAAALCLTLAAAGPMTPATGPTTSPTTAPVSAAPVGLDPQINHWFAQLADPDPAVRDAAGEQLMGLSADGLDRLLDVVQAVPGPVPPAQAEPLHDVVCHVYLATNAAERYVRLGDADDPTHQQPRFVMGIRWTDMADSARLGVPVAERWPGFPARRLLRDGDMILGVYLDPTAPLEQLPNMTTHRRGDLINVIRERAASPDVVLAILRDGRPIRVRMRLAPKPVDADAGAPMATDAFIEARQQRAEEYWQTRFAPALGAAADADDPPGDGKPTPDG